MDQRHGNNLMFEDERTKAAFLRWYKANKETASSVFHTEVVWDGKTRNWTWIVKGKRRDPKRYLLPDELFEI